MESMKWAKLLLGSGALLIPTHFPYRDTIIEGLYSLSQLIPLIFQSDFSGHEDRTQLILKISKLITNVTSNLEIFLESLAYAVGIDSMRRKLILVLESIKAMCRIIKIFLSRRPLMLVNWDKDFLAANGSKHDSFSSMMSSDTDILEGLRSDVYLNFYRKVSCSILRRFLRSTRPHPAPQDFTEAQDFIDEEIPYALHEDKCGTFIQENASTFQGRRSGIRISQLSLHSLPTQYDQLDRQPISQGLENREKTWISARIGDDELLLIGELIYIARPVAQALLTLPTSQSTFSLSLWTAPANLDTTSIVQDALALLLCFMMELCSIECSSAALARKRSVAAEAAVEELLQGQESDREQLRKRLRLLEAGGGQGGHPFDLELKRRRMALFYYLIRSPLFNRATLPLLKTAVRRLKATPVIGTILMPDYIMGVLVYLNKFHFYNSNS